MVILEGGRGGDAGRVCGPSTCGEWSAMEVVSLSVAIFCFFQVSSLSGLTGMAVLFTLVVEFFVGATAITFLCTV